MAKTVFFNEHEWTNWHLSLRDVPISGRFEIHNSDGNATLGRMIESVAALQALIGRAFDESRRLRAQGSAWSYSEAPAGPGGYMLATGYANWLFPLPPSHVRPDFAGHTDGLILCQTGVSVAELNMFLERRGRSLATTGASNGQTFVGAMSTGTHGSAVRQSAIQGQVRAIQLIPAPDMNLWIEPASRRVTDGRLAGMLGATVVADDDLFEAVLVGLGAFGVIHAVLVETVPRFLLEMNRRRMPLSEGIALAMRGESFREAQLPGPPADPYFFQSVVNEHIDPGAAYVTTGHKLPWLESHRLTYDHQNSRGPGYDLAVVVANLVSAVPGVTPPITRAVLSDQLRPITGLTRSWGQSFNFTTPRAGTAGASIAVPAPRTFEALEIMQFALRSVGNAPVAFACRYAAKSPGLLAFTRFPKTTIVDIDGLDNRRTREVMQRAVLAMRSAGVPHAEHWGKLNQMTADSIREAYGAQLDLWIRKRTQLLDRRGEYVFGSQFLDRLGMTSALF